MSPRLEKPRKRNPPGVSFSGPACGAPCAELPPGKAVGIPEIARATTFGPAHFADAATIAPSRSSSLAALLTGHMLQDGEVILLILKPSLWFIVLSSLRWAAVVAIGLVAAKIYVEPGKGAAYLEAGIFVLAGRLMFAVLQWMSRVYVLTDMRILRLAGIFTPELFDCPLRKIAGTRVSFTTRERVLGLGSIDIASADPDCGSTQWQTIAKPRHVHEQIVAAIQRAKQGGSPGAGG